MFKLSALFISLSLALTLFLSYELGLLGFTPVAASEGEPPAAAETGEGIESLNRSLQERTKQLEDKEAELTRRERSVRDKEVVFAQQLDRYEKIIQELKTKVAKLEAMNLAKVDAYRKLYEKMEPKKVAAIFEEMDPYLVSEILVAMKSQTSVDIMAKMPTAKVRLLTEKFLIKRLPASTQTSTN